MTFRNGALMGVMAGLLLAGCGSNTGPDLVPVSGRVTLDGKPLPNASIEFIPEKGSPSYGATDSDGHYSLAYNQNENGAMVGKHRVRISTYRKADADEDGNEIPAVPEKVPAKYNSATTLVKEVKPGGGDINFDLDSKGDKSATAGG